jgi:hypothetical protein
MAYRGLRGGFSTGHFNWEPVMAYIFRQRFYPQIALALALLVIIGFSRTYYLRFLSDLPPMVTLVHLHGITFTAWLALFVAQTQLIARDRVDLHMKLGIFGVVLAVAVFAVGLLTALHTAAIPRVRQSGLAPAQFSIVPLTSIAIFAILVTLGVLLRKHAATHKRLMVLSMFAVIGPAVGRLINLAGVGKYGYIIHPILVATFVAWCLVYDWRKYRMVHPVFLIGGVALVASWPIRMAIARSDWWQPVADWIASLRVLA